MLPLVPSHRFDPNRKPGQHQRFEPGPVHRDRKLEWADFAREWGLGVTICIVAKSALDDCIVAVSDRRLSYSQDGQDVYEASEEGAFKTFQIAKRWGALFSCNDTSPILDLMRRIRANLPPQYRRDVTPTLAMVQKAASDAYAAAARDRIVSSHLSRWDFQSIEQFRETGLREFGPERFEQYARIIENFDLGVILLIYGFEDAVDSGPAFSHVFEVCNPGQVIDHNIQGFGVIGSGFSPAMAALTYRGKTAFGTVEDTAYRLCEAKFAAETASGVGKATHVRAFHRSGRVAHLGDDDVNALRRIWEETRKQPVPESAEEIIHTRFRTLIRGADI